MAGLIATLRYPQTISVTGTAFIHSFIHSFKKMLFYIMCLIDEPVSHNPMVKVDATTVRLGKPRDFPSFGWDNEYGNWECE